MTLKNQILEKYTIEELKNFCCSNKIWWSRKIHKQYPTFTLSEINSIVYELLHGSPICKNGNIKKFGINIEVGYVCCKNQCDCYKENKIASNIQKFGATHHLKNKKILEETSIRNIAKYGVENVSQIPGNSSKVKKTKKERYGDENYNNREKNVNTKIQRYNDKNYNNREKAKQTLLINNNVINPSQLIDHKEKTITTNLLNHGVKWFNNKEKKHKTNLDRYKTQEYFGSEQFKSQQQNIFLQNFDRTHPSHRHLDKESIDIISDVNRLRLFMIDKTLYEASLILKYTIGHIRDICIFNNISYTKHSSRWEQELSNLLSEHNIEHIRNDRSQIKPYELDFYIPEHRYAIELNGTYWHSAKILKQRGHNPVKYHQNKYLLAKANNINLLQIFENEWSDDIKTFVVNKILGKNPQNIGICDMYVDARFHPDYNGILSSPCKYGNDLYDCGKIFKVSDY